MKFKFIPILFAALCCISCVTIDHSLGQSLIPEGQKYKIYSVEFPIEEVQLKMADSLSGYSSSRLTLGTIKDDYFGLTKRSCAFTLVPLLDTMDFGKNAKLTRFFITMARDTTSAASEADLKILQNINVYELSEKVQGYDINTPVKHGAARISYGVPVYNGSDSLAFDFSKEFGEKYMSISQEDLSSFDKFVSKYPGIYMDTDSTLSNGGRINMFELQMDVDMQYGLIKGSYAELAFSAEYEGSRKDTSFYFYFGADNFYHLDSLLSLRSSGSIQYLPQYGLNITSHSSRELVGEASDRIIIEGGGGIKPVIPAAQLKRMLEKDILTHGGDPARTLINKATLFLPYNFSDENYKALDYFPEMLNPTCRITSSGGVTFASLTDTSSETEDPGKINYSKNAYAPDITYHTQRLLRTKDGETLSNYDVWFLIMATEKIKSYSSSSMSSGMSDYYNALMYASYYNNIYGGGYGYGGYGYGGYGYGGYGGYGNYGYNSYYNNYMTYALASMYASNSSSGPATSVMLDTHRYYKAELLGPAAGGDRHPTFQVVYSVPEE